MTVETGSFGDALRVWEEALSLTPADATLWELKVRPLRDIKDRLVSAVHDLS